MKPFSLLALSLSFAFSTTTPAAVVAHWKLDDSSGSSTVVDSSGNSRDLSVAGGTAPTLGEAGVSGTASGFAPDGYSVDTNDAAYAAPSYTVSFWLNATVDGSFRSAVSNRNGENGFIFYLRNGRVRYWQRDASGWNEQTVPISNGDWYHVVGTYNGATDTKRFFVTDATGGTFGLDGEQTGVQYFTNDDFAVGARPDGGARLTTGTLVDDVQFYDRALNFNEVQFLFNNPGAIVPEPSTALLSTLGLLALIRRRR